MNRRVVIVAIAIGVLCAGLVAFNFIGAFLFAGAGFMQPPPTNVEVVTAQPGPWQPGIEAVGTARVARALTSRRNRRRRARNQIQSNDRAKAGYSIDDSSNAPT
jgi:multidrug efflux pump subunit AcrA (membrane-fusion protein)